MGGPLANFAGLLHMTMHSLTKSAIFFAVGHIAQVKGTQRIADIKGLSVTHPVLGGRPRARRHRDRRPAAVRRVHRASSCWCRRPLPAQPVFAVVLVLACWSRSARWSCGCRTCCSASRAGRRRGQGVLCAAVPASRDRADGRAVAAGTGGALVPRRGRATGMT